MKATAPPALCAQRPGMTMRVSTVNRVGTVTADTGTRTVPPVAGPQPAPPGTYDPPCPCPCPRPRARRAVTR